jgi:phage tail-like protein
MMKLNKKVFYGGVAGALLTVIVLVAILVLQPAVAGAKSTNPGKNSTPLPAASLPTGLYPANNFRIIIDGVDTSGNFWYVSGIEMKVDVTTEINNNVEKKIAGRLHYAPNGITIRGAYHENIRRWFNNYTSGTSDKKSMSIVFLDGSGNEVLRYNCFEVWPSYYKLGPLSTGGSPAASNAETILQEEFTIQCEKIEEA